MKRFDKDNFRSKVKKIIRKNLSHSFINVDKFANDIVDTALQETKNN